MEMNYDEDALHWLEEELHTPIYPGTEIMSDVGTHQFVKSSDKSNRVLVPQPSADSHDPLNWTRFWKFCSVMMAIVNTFAQGFGPVALAPMFPNLIEAFDTDLAGVVQFTGVCILVLGFSNFLCLKHLAGRSEGLFSFMGACVLNGIGAGPDETLAPTVIADVLFLHERGAYYTLYFTVYFSSVMIGPIIAGSMAEYSHWRNFWWLNVAMQAATLVGLVFLFPETKWHRQHPRELVDKEQQKPHVSTEKGSSQGVKHEESSNTTTDTVEQDPHLHRGVPSKQQFMPWQSNPYPFKAIALDLFIPWKLHLFPIIEFSAFVVSWSASSFLTINLTQSQNFAAPPYNFPPQSVGYTNFATLVGALIGLATNGPLSDWIADRATRRNRGIREPEMRLPALIPHVIIMLVSNFVVAFGCQHKWDWRVIVVVGYACGGIQVAAIPAIASTYAVDSYKPVAGSIFVAITVNKNLWGYGFSKFITPWIIADGYVPPIMLNMCLIFFWCSFGIVFYYYGKTFRKWTRNSTVHNL